MRRVKCMTWPRKIASASSGSILLNNYCTRVLNKPEEMQARSVTSIDRLLKIAERKVTGSNPAEGMRIFFGQNGRQRTSSGDFLCSLMPAIMYMLVLVPVYVPILPWLK